MHLLSGQLTETPRAVEHFKLPSTKAPSHLQVADSNC
jgi:hypothetical protein